MLNATKGEVLIIEQALSENAKQGIATGDQASADANAEGTITHEASASSDNSAGSNATENDGRTLSSTASIPSASPANSSADSQIASPEIPSTLFVHVGGCVLAPGVVELAASSRVSDAITAAGGFSETAAPDALNLARLVTDGERIIVPSWEEYEASKSSYDAAFETGSKATSSSVEPTSTSSTGGSTVSNGLININTATAAELQTLNGVGPSTAEKIIADREASGPFNTIEDLMRVSGIGEKKFAALAPYICVG